MERLFTVSDAISSLVPTAKFSAFYNDDGTVNKINWVGGGTQPTEVEINAEISRLQTEYDNKQYARDRSIAYPPIGDQLDALWKGGDEATAMKVIIDKVKSDNPKG